MRFSYHDLWGVTAMMIASLTLSAAEPVPAPYEIQVPNYPEITFVDGVPDSFAASAGSSLAIVKAPSRSADAGLRWQWQKPGATLTFTDADGFLHLTGQDPDPIVYEWITYTGLSAFSLWVYNETPIKDVLWFEIGDGKTVSSRFWMSLNYSGWQRCMALYGRDIQPLGGFPDQKTSTTLSITAPASVATGSLYFDDFTPRWEQDVRFVNPSVALPWIRPLDRKLEVIDPAAYAAGTWKSKIVKSEEPKFVPDDTPITAVQKMAIDRMRAMWQPWEMPAATGTVPERELVFLRKVYAERKFARVGNAISGDPGSNHGQYWFQAGRFAQAYRQAKGNDELQAEMLACYFDYIDYAIAYGVGRGYGLRTAFVQPVWLMRKELQETGRFEPILGWMKSVTQMDQWYDLFSKSDADVYNTMLVAQVHTALMQLDDQQVHRDLQALSYWLERTARYGEIKDDGSFFHHNQTYSGYNLPAIGPWVDVLTLLHGSEYMAPFSHLIARRTVFAMHAYSCIYSIPHTLSGRHRGSAYFDGYKLCAKLADLGDPRTGEPFDREMAEISLYYANYKDIEDETVERFRAMGLKPANTDMHLALNYTVALIHRRDDWMVFFRGQRDPFFATESYGGASSLGRYMNFGHMAILSAGEPTNSKDSEWDPGKDDINGFHYAYWPGTTSRDIPLNALYSHFPISEQTTDETFAVGTHLDKDGIFGMKLQEDLPGATHADRIGPVRYFLGETEYQKRIKDSMYDTSFRARKSVFAFDDRILCLGSGIHSDDAEHRVVTALIQRHLNEAMQGRFHLASDTPELRFPLSRDIPSGPATWFIDSLGNGYLLPEGHAPLEFRRQHQVLEFQPFQNDRHAEIKTQTSEGDTEYVLLDHGKAPEEATYQYTIIMRATPERMASFAVSPMPYEILQQDDRAHVVHDTPSNTTGFVFFERGGHNGVSVDAPCVVMLRHTDEQSAIISLCNPELRSMENDANDPLRPSSEAIKTTVTIPGRWQLDAEQPDVTADHADGSTRIVVTNHDLIPTVAQLKRVP